MKDDDPGNEVDRHAAQGATTPEDPQATYQEQGRPFLGAPLQCIEFPSQQVAHCLSLDENELGSAGEPTEMGNSTDQSHESPPGTQFRLMPRKPHLIDRSPAMNARGRKRPAQSMNSAHLMRDQAPSSPLTSNMLGMQSLSLHSPRPKSTAPESPAHSCRSFLTVGSPSSSFSKVEGSPFRERRSYSIGTACDRPKDHMLLSPKVVPLTVLTHCEPAKLSTPSRAPPTFMSPPRSTPRNSASLLRSPFSGPHGPTLGTPQSLPRTPGDFSFSTPNSTLNDTPLPRISLTPRSSSSRHRRGAVPRFPSPTDLEPRPPPPPLPFVLRNPSNNPGATDANGATAAPFVSTESSTSSAAAAAATEVKDPPTIARSLLDCPLDNFLISRQDGGAGIDLDTESLSDDDSDDFLLAFPSTIIEEKQQQMSATRQAKQPRINGLSRAMASTNSMSVSSLLGMAYATSENNLHNSMSSCNYGDTIIPHVAGLKREESVASIGLTLDAPMTVGDSSRADLVTPPPVDADTSNLILGPPALHKSCKGTGATITEAEDALTGLPAGNSGLVSFSLEPKPSPPTLA